MKKVFLVVLMGVLVSGCAVIGSRGLAVRLEGPSFVEKILGAGRVSSVSVTNATNFYLKLVVLNKEVAVIGPGATIFSQKSFEFDYTELSVTALIFSNGNKGDNIIGVAGTVLRLRYGYPTNWVIHNSDIRYFNGAPKFGRNVGVVVDDSSGGEVDLPRIVLKSTTALQIVNGSSYEADIKINGQKVWTLKSGDIGYREYYYPYDYPKQMRVEVVFFSGNAFVGHYENYFQIGGNYIGPRATQFVLAKEMIRR